MTEAAKTCTDCGEVKPLSDFHPNRKMKDGHLNQCKPCRRTQARAYNRANRERVRANMRAWTAANRDRVSATQQTHRERNREKHRARDAVYKALREGRLQRGSCEDCGATENVQAHHDDYSKRLDVRWLCRDCHYAHHHRDIEKAAA